MYLAALKLFQLLHGNLRIIVCGCTDGKRNEDLVGMESRVTVTQMLGFSMLYRLDDLS